MSETTQHEHERPEPVTPEDACRRCGGSMEKTGGVPTNGTKICQLCVMEDWLDEAGR